MLCRSPNSPRLKRRRGCGALPRRLARLNVQQPAVSRRIAALEARLGGPLFLRTKPRLTLTANGETLFRAVSKGFQSIRAEIQRLEAAHGAAPVVVNASIGFTSLYLMPRLGEFHARHPEHSVQIVTPRSEPRL